MNILYGLVFTVLLIGPSFAAQEPLDSSSQTEEDGNKPYTGQDVKNGRGINATSVQINYFVGKLDIKSLDTRDVIVQATGSEEALATLIIQVVDGQLVVSQNDLTRNYPKLAEDLQLAILMPATMPLALTMTGGKAKIADRQEKTVFDIRGTASVAAGSIKGDLDVTIKGSGDIEVRELASEEVKASIYGTGNIKFLSGLVGKFDAAIAGSGSIFFHGETKDANLLVNGSGNILINKVAGPLKKEILGTGTIKVNLP